MTHPSRRGFLVTAAAAAALRTPLIHALDSATGDGAAGDKAEEYSPLRRRGMEKDKVKTGERGGGGDRRGVRTDLVFEGDAFGKIRGADPLGGALWATGRPRPALAACPYEPTRGSAADQGVRPTTSTPGQLIAKS